MCVCGGGGGGGGGGVGYGSAVRDWPWGLGQRGGPGRVESGVESNTLLPRPIQNYISLVLMLVA